MGFQDLFRAWRGKGILSQTLDEFTRMIEHGHWMYQTATTSLWEPPDNGEKKQQIRDRDIKVNKLERAIRKKIVQHLAIAPGTDVNYCLVLMSVVKDAERLGDYCKNLVEISEYYPMHQDDHKLVADFKDIQAEVEVMFRKVGKTFRDSDEALGKKLVEMEVAQAKTCDRLIEKVLKSDDLTIPQAVCYTLLARYAKRISAHLGNIASAVVMPVHKLDYYDESAVPGKETKRAGDP